MTALETLVHIALETFDEDALIHLLSDDDPLVKESAAFRLHQVGGDKTLRHATTAARSPRWQERYLAAFVLGQLGYPKYRLAAESEPILIALLESDRSSKVRAAAAIALGHLGCGVAALRSARRDPHADVRRAVTTALQC